MKIIVVSKVEWDDQNSSGNTFSNFFEGWKECDFMHVYAREPRPINNSCKKYFKIPVFSILKNFFFPWKIGEFFCLEGENDSRLSKKNKHDGAEKKLIALSKRKNVWWMYLLDDFLYSTGIWKNRKYKRAIKDFNPDIVFYEVRSEACIYQNIRYLKENTKAKVVGFIMDDVYGTYEKKHNLYGQILKSRFKHFTKITDKMYGISHKMCEVYGKRFCIPMSVLHKGCDITEVRSVVNTPIIINYAGNLGYGRYKSLAILAQAIKKINSENRKLELQIYTGTTITQDISDLLNVEGASKIYGRASYEDIKHIQRNSDIVLHVESFSPEQIEIVRFSFSTKITDCLQSGAVMMVIGPKGISPTEEPKKIPGSIVISDLNEIESTLRLLVNNKEDLLCRAAATNSYARRHFDLKVVRDNLKNDFVTLLS